MIFTELLQKLIFAFFWYLQRVLEDRYKCYVAENKFCASEHGYDLKQSFLLTMDMKVKNMDDQ